MRDLLFEEGRFQLNPNAVPNPGRGYERLKKGCVRQIHSVMLADEIHPLVKDPGVLEVLNQAFGDWKITYHLVQYDPAILQEKPHFFAEKWGNTLRGACQVRPWQV